MVPAPESFVARSQVPVYALAFASPDTLLYAGGGGKSKSGVANVIASAEVDFGTRKFAESGEIKLSSGEDAPMCMALAPSGRGAVTGGSDDDEEEDGDSDTDHASSKLQASTSTAERPQRIIVGINGSLAPGTVNENLRSFNWAALSSPEKDAGPSDGDAKVKRHAITAMGTGASVKIDDDDTYIRTNATSPNGQFLAIGSTDGQVALHELPSLRLLWSAPAREDGGGILDTSFSADSALLAVVMPTEVIVYPTAARGAETVGSPQSARGPPEPFQTIRNPTLKGITGCSFRAARFGRNSRDKSSGHVVGSSNRLYTVVNADPPAGLGTSRRDRELARIRKCLVSSWNTDSWTLIRTRQVSERPATVMELSLSGDVLAIGTSDLALHLLSTDSLRTIWQLKDTHAFPSTCLAFDPRGQTLASGSADMTVRIVDVGKNRGAQLLGQDLAKSRAVILLLALIFALFAWQLQSRLIKP